MGVPSLFIAHPSGIDCSFREAISTFPRATTEVAMSSTKLSPFCPGAAKEIGLVPKKGFLPRVAVTSGDALVKAIPCGGDKAPLATEAH